MTSCFDLDHKSMKTFFILGGIRLNNSNNNNNIKGIALGSYYIMNQSNKGAPSFK